MAYVQFPILTLVRAQNPWIRCICSTPFENTRPRTAASPVPVPGSAKVDTTGIMILAVRHLSQSISNIGFSVKSPSVWNSVGNRWAVLPRPDALSILRGAISVNT
jgi:hypothetical protein